MIFTWNLLRKRKNSVATDYWKKINKLAINYRFFRFLAIDHSTFLWILFFSQLLGPSNNLNHEKKLNSSNLICDLGLWSRELNILNKN